MKKFTGLVIILVVLLLGSYYGMGYLTEKQVKEDLKTVNQSNGLTVNLEGYNRGWFTSKAILNWGLHIPAHVVSSADGQSETVAAQDFQMKMPLTIHHGPVIFADKSVKFGLGYAHTELLLPEKFAQQFNNAFSSESTQPKLDLSLFVSYLLNTNIDASVPAFKLIAKQGNGQLDWLGMTSSTSLSPDMKKVSGNITVDGLRIAKGPIKTDMSSVTSEYNLHKTSSGLYLGDASLSFPSLVITNNDKKIFELAQFDVHSDTNIEEGLFNSHFKSSIEKIATNDKTYGPGRLEVAIRNLDADALARINQQANQLQQGPDAQRQQALLAILPELPQLFSKGAEFEVTELNFVMPQGTIEGNLMVSLPKSATTNPFELIQKIQGNGKLKVPSVVVKELISESIRQKMLAAPQPPQTIQQGIVQQMQQQAGTAPAGSSNNATPPATIDLNAVAQQASAAADKQIATMIQSGVLAVQGNDYVIEANLNQGQLMVNGKPFNPGMLKFQ
ncbi:putative membrane protein YdgA-like protein [Legionella nautarum]|uniref:Putative membrane protein YdgA-like protein n=1 Tax=Legionella nautarum TaxID=45070 RepID=A0A0W0WLG5_9GAMM|nr:YdgA family protein [Legionella nautarum]KTD33160.1 putative membrane protein YdgA-like protein [Legionella nautarum]